MDRVSTLAFKSALAIGCRYRDKVNVQIALMILLATRPGHVVILAELTEWLWGDDPSGGPIDPEENIRAAIFKLRRKGYAITSHGNERYSYDPWNDSQRKEST